MKHRLCLLLIISIAALQESGAASAPATSSGRHCAAISLTDNQAYYMASCAAVLILAWVIGYYVLRFMKGRLRLDLARKIVRSGEGLSGQVMLEVKKSIRGQLTAALVGREERIRRTSNSSNSKEWAEVYRQSRVLEKTRAFPKGFRQTYEFAIVAPSRAEVSPVLGLRQLAEKAGAGVPGRLLRGTASSLEALMQPRMRWHMEVRLDADGVDLFTKRKVGVQLRD